MVTARDRELLYLRTIIRKAITGSNVAVSNRLGAISIQALATVAAHALLADLGMACSLKEDLSTAPAWSDLSLIIGRRSGSVSAEPPPAIEPA